MLQPQRDEEFRVEILLLHWLHWIKIFCGKIVIILGNIFLYFPNLLNSILGKNLSIVISIYESGFMGFAHGFSLY